MRVVNLLINHSFQMTTTLTSMVINSTSGSSGVGYVTQANDANEGGTALNSAMLLFCSAYAAICAIGLAGFTNCANIS